MRKNTNPHITPADRAAWAAGAAQAAALATATSLESRVARVEDGIFNNITGIQHSLCDNVLEPAFSRSFIRDNYASQRGRGTHDGLYRLEEFMRSYYFSRKAKAEQESREEELPRLSPAEYADGWVLKCDISKYFYSIRHEPLKRIVRQYIKDG